MNDKRDAETNLLLDIQKIIGADKPYEGVHLARYVESREAELRRQIADELDSVNTLLCSPAPSVGYRKLVNIITELRGSK
jgi:hypothetical protein